MKPHTPPILSGLPFLLVPAPPKSADVLLDQMDMIRLGTYRYANGNAIGGEVKFNLPDQAAIEIANDFTTTKGALIVNQVEVGNLLYEDSSVIRDVRVSIYPDNDGTPGNEAVYSRRFSTPGDISPAIVPGVRNIEFDDGLIGLRGVWTIVSGLHIVLEPGTTYFLCVQVVTGPDDWAYTVREDKILYGADSFTRDGPPDEDRCHCGWGFTDFRSFADIDNRPGDAAYRIVASGASPAPPSGPDRSMDQADPRQPPPPPAVPGRRGRKESDEAAHPAYP